MTKTCGTSSLQNRASVGGGRGSQNSRHSGGPQQFGVTSNQQVVNLMGNGAGGNNALMAAGTVKTNNHGGSNSNGAGGIACFGGLVHRS